MENNEQPTDEKQGRRPRRLRRAVLALLGIAALALLAVLIMAPSMLDRSINRVADPAPYTVSDKAIELHRDLFVADLHCDALMWPRDLGKPGPRGHVNLPRLIEGGVALQCFSTVTRIPARTSMQRTQDGWDVLVPLNVLQGWPMATWFSPRERALHMAGRFDRAVRRSEGRLVPIRTKEDLSRYRERRTRDSRCTAGMLTIEGLHCLEGGRENTRVMFNAGFRLMGLVHFHDNRIGGSAHGVEKGGLTDFGRDVVQFMDLLKITIDLAHASPKLIDDVLDLTQRPVLVSHTGMRGMHDSIRNLSDENARRIADKGGVIGIGFWSGATGGQGIGPIVEHIRYAVNLVGEDHVALGSDFDGATTVPFDASGMPLLTEALEEHGFSVQAIRKVMGGNLLRFFGENLPSETDTAYPDRDT